MPAGNSVSRPIQNHFLGLCRLIAEWRNEMGDYEVTVRDVAKEIEEKYLSTYDIEIVVHTDTKKWTGNSNQTILETLDKVRADWAKMGLYLPEISEFHKGE